MQLLDAPFSPARPPLLVLGPAGWPVGHASGAVADGLVLAGRLLKLEGWAGVLQLPSEHTELPADIGPSGSDDESDDGTAAARLVPTHFDDTEQPDRLGVKWRHTAAAAHHHTASWRSISAVCADACTRGWLDGLASDGLDSCMAVAPSTHPRNAAVDPIGAAINALGIRPGEVVVELPALGVGHCSVQLDRKLATVGSGYGGRVEAAAAAVAEGEAVAAQLQVLFCATVCVALPVSHSTAVMCVRQAELEVLRQDRTQLEAAAKVAGRLTEVYLELEELCEDGGGSGKVWLAVDDVSSSGHRAIHARDGRRQLLSFLYRRSMRPGRRSVTRCNGGRRRTPGRWLQRCAQSVFRAEVSSIKRSKGFLWSTGDRCGPRCSLQGVRGSGG